MEGSRSEFIFSATRAQDARLRTVSVEATTRESAEKSVHDAGYAIDALLAIIPKTYSQPQMLEQATGTNK